MKQKSSHTLRSVAVILVTAGIISCNCNPSRKCCSGYTGTLTDSSAIALKNKDHFISKDSIIAWTARYQVNKALIDNDSLPLVGKVLGDSCSFNHCFVKALLCHENCIGLRVIYGMDTAMKVHIILVGIQPDYSTLYIYKPKDCVPPVKKAAGSSGPRDEEMGTGGGHGGPGGLEYGQIP